MRRPRTLLPLAALSAAALAAPAVHADPIDLGQIVVSANLVPTEANKVGSTVDVVTQKQIDRSADSTVAGVLRSVPGFSLRAKGGVGQQASFTLRGASQMYVGVQVDGIDVTDPSSTQVSFDFGHLATGGISRIEVLKGSQSALYGSSAIGGVIDISSRHATEPGIHHYLWVEGGTKKTLNGSYSFTDKRDHSDFALTLSHTGTSGYPVWVGAYADGKDYGYWSSRIAANGSFTLENGVTLGFAGFAETYHGDYFPGTYAASIDPTAAGWAGAKTGGLRVYGKFSLGQVENTLSVQTFRVARHYVITPASVGADYTYTGSRVALNYRGKVRLGDKGRLVFGADSKRDVYDQSGDYGSAHSARRINGAFAELVYTPTGALSVTGALRRDHDSRFGGANTWRLSAAWTPRSDITVRASAGTGFRAPSNFELFSPNGDPSLQPEKSRSYDLGIEKRFGEGSHLRATLFRLSADNLIGFDYAATSCGSPWGCYAQLSGRVRRQGLELEGATTIGKVTVTGSYTYTDSWTDNSASSSNWAIPPKHMVSLDLSAPVMKKLTAGLTLTGAAGRPSLPNYAVLDARLTYQIDARTEAYLRVENITDTRYQMVQDYAQPGRTLYVGLRKSF